MKNDIQTLPGLSAMPQNPIRIAAGDQAQMFKWLPVENQVARFQQNNIPLYVTPRIVSAPALPTPGAFFNDPRATFSRLLESVNGVKDGQN